MIEHERIVARRSELGMSQAELARLVGVSQPAIVDIEKGRVRSSKFVREIAYALSLNVREVDPSFSEWPSATVEAGGELAVFTLIERDGRSDISASPVNVIPRPALLAHVPGAYALQVTSEAMAPEFEPGDNLLINPHLPAIQGYSFLFRGEEDTSSAILRRLVSFDDKNWSVMAWKGLVPSDLLRSEWPRCHRIVGKFSRG